MLISSFSPPPQMMFNNSARSKRSFSDYSSSSSPSTDSANTTPDAHLMQTDDDLKCLPFLQTFDWQDQISVSDYGQQSSCSLEYSPRGMSCMSMSSMSPRPVFKPNALPPLTIQNPANMIEHEFKQCQPKLNNQFNNAQHDLININDQNHCAPVFCNPSDVVRKKPAGLGMQQQYQMFQKRHHAHFQNVSPLSCEEDSKFEFCPFPAGIAGGIACDVSVSDNTPLETPLTSPHSHATLSSSMQDEVMSPDFYFHRATSLASMMPEKKTDTNSKTTLTYRVAFSDHTRDCSLGFRLSPSYVKIGDPVSVSATRGQESLGVVVEIMSGGGGDGNNNTNSNDKRDPSVGRILRLATQNEVTQMRGVVQQRGGVEGGVTGPDFSHVVY